jgi:hypothetical protein
MDKQCLPLVDEDGKLIPPPKTEFLGQSYANYIGKEHADIFHKFSSMHRENAEYLKPQPMPNNQEKKIEDYLHLYLGCDCMYGSHHEPQAVKYKLTAENLSEATKFDFPILRPLSDMSEDDFHSFFSTTDADILITATINRLWCAGHYPKKEYDERVAEELPVEPIDLIYELEECDYASVFSTTKRGDLAHGCSDEMRYFMDVETLAAWHSHLRKRGIDVDGLLKAGLAIDKTKL